MEVQSRFPFRCLHFALRGLAVRVFAVRTSHFAVICTEAESDMRVQICAFAVHARISVSSLAFLCDSPAFFNGVSKAGATRSSVRILARWVSEAFKMASWRKEYIARRARSGCSSKEIRRLLEIEHGITLRCLSY